MIFQDQAQAAGASPVGMVGSPFERAGVRIPAALDVERGGLALACDRDRDLRALLAAQDLRRGRELSALVVEGETPIGVPERDGSAQQQQQGRDEVTRSGRFARISASTHRRCLPSDQPAFDWPAFGESAFGSGELYSWSHPDTMSADT